MGKGSACTPGQCIHYTKINLESIKCLKQLSELLFTIVAGTVVVNCSIEEIF